MHNSKQANSLKYYLSPPKKAYVDVMRERKGERSARGKGTRRGKQESNKCSAAAPDPTTL
jgi:hypothetical protein